MGLSETYINILNHPAVDATINFIKKFKSSKSYWSVSYLILLFTIREAVAWKFGSAIKTFCETQAVDSSFPTFWEVLGFVLDVGGSWELVALGTFVFVVLSLVKIAESEGTSISVRENYLTLFLVVFVGSLSFYQNDEVKIIVEENHKVLKKIEQDKNVTNYLIEDAKNKKLKYAKLEAKYEGLRKSIREKAPNEKEIIDNANKILEEKGIESAIYYFNIELSFLEKQEKINELVSKKQEMVGVDKSIDYQKLLFKSIGVKNINYDISTDTKFIKLGTNTYTFKGKYLLNDNIIVISKKMIVKIDLIIKNSIEEFQLIGENFKDKFDSLDSSKYREEIKYITSQMISERLHIFEKNSQQLYKIFFNNKIALSTLNTDREMIDAKSKNDKLELFIYNITSRYSLLLASNFKEYIECIRYDNDVLSTYNLSNLSKEKSISSSISSIKKISTKKNLENLIESCSNDFSSLTKKFTLYKVAIDLSISSEKKRITITRNFMQLYLGKVPSSENISSFLHSFDKFPKENLFELIQNIDRLIQSY